MSSKPHQQRASVADTTRQIFISNQYEHKEITTKSHHLSSITACLHQIYCCCLHHLLCGVNPAIVNWLSGFEFRWQRSSQSCGDDDEASSAACALPKLCKWYHESTRTCKGISDLQTKYPQPKRSLSFALSLSLYLSVVHKWSILKSHLTLNYTSVFFIFCSCHKTK